jgi:hypothetical protein
MGMNGKSEITISSIGVFATFAASAISHLHRSQIILSFGQTASSQT